MFSCQVGLHAQLQGKANQQLRPALQIAVHRLHANGDVHWGALRSKGRPAKTVASATRCMMEENLPRCAFYLRDCAAKSRSQRPHSDKSEDECDHLEQGVYGAKCEQHGCDGLPMPIAAIFCRNLRYKRANRRQNAGEIR